VLHPDGSITQTSCNAIGKVETQTDVHRDVRMARAQDAQERRPSCASPATAPISSAQKKKRRSFQQLLIDAFF
jgi:hypothetical protein